MSQISPGGIFVARHRFRPYCTVVAPTLDALLLGLTEHSLDTSGRVNFDDLFINHHQADGDWAVVVNTSPDDDTARPWGSLNCPGSAPSLPHMRKKVPSSPKHWMR